MTKNIIDSIISSAQSAGYEVRTPYGVARDITPSYSIGKNQAGTLAIVSKDGEIMMMDSCGIPRRVKLLRELEEQFQRDRIPFKRSQERYREQMGVGQVFSRPEIEIKPLEDVVIHTPTEEDLELVLKVCRGQKEGLSICFPLAPGERFSDRDAPRNPVRFFQVYGVYTGIDGDIKTSKDRPNYNEIDILNLAKADLRDKKIILPEEFYEMQRITLKQIMELVRHQNTTQ